MTNQRQPSEPPRNPARWWWPLKHWTPLEAVIVVGGSAACVGLAIWLESLHGWWATVLETYLFAFVLCGASASTYGAWVLDDADDEATERNVLPWLIAIAIGCPALLVLGIHAFGTPFDAAPGDWPAGVDLAARLAISIPLALAALFCLIAPAWRRTVSWLLWTLAALFAATLAVLAAWPWLGAGFPIWARGSICGAALAAAAVLAKRIPPRNHGRASGGA